jgi:Tfp pilus assembly protein PilF
MQNSSFTSNIDDKTSVLVQMKYDLEGINWLNQNVTGLHAIAELPLEYYRAGGMRVASNTGLPMVIGGLHQNEQRSGVYDRLVGDRTADMNTFFTTPDVQVALTLISKYDIEYIYLGQVEQARAGTSGMNKFAQMAADDVGILTEVFHSDNPPSIPGTIIYKVNHGDKDPRVLVGAPVEGSGLPGISITPLPTSTPLPAPTPPVDDPVLKVLIANVTANPQDHDARQQLVNWYRDHDYPLEAAEQLEILVQQNPTDISIRSQLGDMYQTAGQPDKALQAWEAARDVAPNNPDAHNKLGLAYVDRKRFDDALAEFQAAVGANAAFAESWFHMGEVYEIKGDRNSAVQAYQSAVDSGSDDNSWKAAAQDRLNQLR